MKYYMIKNWFLYNIYLLLFTKESSQWRFDTFLLLGRRYSRSSCWCHISWKSCDGVLVKTFLAAVTRGERWWWCVRLSLPKHTAFYCLNYIYFELQTKHIACGEKDKEGFLRSSICFNVNILNYNNEILF